MSVLYVVRHGQASFFADDYDQLSDLGVEQSRKLGKYWADSQIEIDEVYSGTLKRQRQTAQYVGEGYRSVGKRWPETQTIEGLNEYGGENVMETIKDELVVADPAIRQLNLEYEQASGEREEYRTYHRLLDALMFAYIDGAYESQVSETWDQFHTRVSDAFSQIRSKSGTGRRIAVFTSGGPLSISVQSTLQAPHRAVGDLNWRVYNSGVTKFTFRADRIVMDQFNMIGHLPDESHHSYR